MGTLGSFAITRLVENCSHVAGNSSNFQEGNLKRGSFLNQGSWKYRNGLPTASRLQKNEKCSQCAVKFSFANKSGEGNTKKPLWKVRGVAAVLQGETGSVNVVPLKIIISGAPASGKGTQCEEIVRKYGLTHISAGDLLRSEVAAGSENGRRAQSFMDAGSLVPDDVIISIVKDRLSQRDSLENGWLLDGYPRSASQAEALEAAGIEPQLFIVLEVPDDVLVARVSGRRQDPVTGRIYHLQFSPPESEEVASRLTQRSDDTEEKVKARLVTHKSHVDAVLAKYKDLVRVVDGSRSKEEVFADIDGILAALCQQQRGVQDGQWVGVPTRLNSTPHTREIRSYFYRDACKATGRAVSEGLTRLKVYVSIPELNPEMDVYRIGTLMELIREMAFQFARQGRVVRVCVQGPMGVGVFSGMPLALAGTRFILEQMDWGEEVSQGRIRLGAVGREEVREDDDMFIVMAPQNAVGNCIIEFLEAMAEAAGDRPFIIVNPRLQDLPGAGGVMQVAGRAARLDFVASFTPCYDFRLLYRKGTQYPILGAVRMAVRGEYEVYRRVDVAGGAEEYRLMDVLPSQPDSSQIVAAFAGRKTEAPGGFWRSFAAFFSLDG